MTEHARYRIDPKDERGRLEIDTSAPLTIQIRTASGLLDMLTYILRAEPGLPTITTAVRRLFRNLYIENNNLRFYVKDIKQELLDRHHAEMTLIEKAAGVLRSETATDETRRRMADALDETSNALSADVEKLRKDIRYHESMLP